MWKSFDINDLFSIYSGKDVSLENNIGLTPYINSSSLNNGHVAYIKNTTNLYSNVITVARTGSVGSTFYHENEICVSNNIRVLDLKCGKLNKYTALFLITMFKKSIHGKFEYGKILGSERIKKQKIMLPVNDNDEPDFDWMESFIKKRYDIALKKTNLFKKHVVQPTNNTNWSTFTINDIAYIHGGKDWPKLERTIGKTPFIGSSSLKNGVTDFVSLKDKKHVSKNAISINRNGSVGYAFYHPYEAYFSGDTRYIILKEHSNNQYVNRFIAVMIQSQKEKYAFGYKLGTDRIKKQKIMLPINRNGDINYVYMENYMKQIENNHIDKLTSLK